MLVDSLFDGTRGGNHQWGVAITKIIRGGYQRTQTRHAPRENTSCGKINLYYQSTPFAPHGFKCFHSGERNNAPLNPIFECIGGTWAEWGEWSACTESCGGTGTKTRTRGCADTIQCTGETSDTRVCNTELCPIEPSLLGTCTCAGSAYFCYGSNHPQLKCASDELCQKVSMNPSEPYRCIPRTLGMCQSSGDPHVKTFDGVQNDVYGVAKYIFSETTDAIEDVPDFEVIMETAPYGQVSITGAAHLRFRSPDGATEYIITTDLDGGATITVDGQTSDLVDQINESFEFRRFPGRVKVTTWFGLWINHEGWTLSLHVPAVYQGNIRGICGNYNMEKDDEFQKPDGTVYDCSDDNGYDISQCEFDSACSWMVTGDCGPGPGEVTLGCPLANECEDMFNADWLAECRAVIDPSSAISDCELDICMADNEMDAKRQLISDYIGRCALSLGDDEDVICNWTGLSGLGPACGENEFWNGCAKPCAESRPCDVNIQTCPDEEETAGMCLCKGGFRMHNGACIAVADCPLPNGDWSEWTGWGSCSVTCADGSQTRSRYCLGPGPCEDGPTERVQNCNDGPCPVLAPDDATVFGNYPCLSDCGGEGGQCDFCEAHFSGSVSNSMTGFCCAVPDSKAHLNGDCTAQMIADLKNSAYGTLGHHMCVFADVGSYSDWTDWSSCTKTCGGGSKSRGRTCDTDNCAGVPNEAKVCNTQDCPVVVTDLSNCACAGGAWSCPSNDCNTRTERCERVDYSGTYKCKPKTLGECKAWGDPHMISFDQQLIDVYGVGKYIFSTSENVPQTLPFYKVRFIFLQFYYSVFLDFL